MKFKTAILLGILLLGGTSAFAQNCPKVEVPASTTSTCWISFWTGLLGPLALGELLYSTNAVGRRASRTFSVEHLWAG